MAVIVRPAKVPAPTRSTNSSPATTANDPITPPSGAHQGMPDMPSAVGICLGRQSHSVPRNATIGRKETVLASHGFESDLRRAPFIGGPQACSTPARRMMG